LCSVLRPLQHSIGYMGDDFYRSKDPINSIKVLKGHIQCSVPANTNFPLHPLIRGMACTRDYAFRMNVMEEIFEIRSCSLKDCNNTIRIQSPYPDGCIGAGHTWTPYCSVCFASSSASSQVVPISYRVHFFFVPSWKCVQQFAWCYKPVFLF